MKPVGGDFDVAEFGDRKFLAAAIVACVSAIRPLTTTEQYTLDLIVLLAVKIFVGGDMKIDVSTQNRMLAVNITREIEARADELRHGGVRDPVARALKEAAERYQHASGPALNRWLRRWRARNR